MDKLARQMNSSSRKLEKELTEALGRAIELAKTKSQKLTPVDTGYLRSSIGGSGGYSFVRGLRAGVGTNVKYAIYVHENIRSRHTIGESKFMEKGAKQALPFIQKEINKVAKTVTVHIAK